MNHHYRNNWNEFQWEREIRRDERRISCYFGELVSCLDLPGEEELIGGILGERPDLVPTGGPDVLRRERMFFRDGDDEDDDGAENTAPVRRGNAVDCLDALAVEWNLAVVSRLRSDAFLPGLGVGCAYAKLLARVADFIDADPASERGLKISLGKRALADLNDLIGGLRRLAGFQRSLGSEINSHIARLGQVREQLLDLLIRERSR